VIFHSPWNGFPDVAVQTTVAKLKAHPDYHAAKHADQDAALRVIAEVFKPGKVTDSCDLIVPVLQLDQGKQNMLAIGPRIRRRSILRHFPIEPGVTHWSRCGHSDTWTTHLCRPDRAWATCSYCGRCRHVRLHARKLARLDRTSRRPCRPSHDTRRYFWRHKASAIKGCFCQAAREITRGRNLVTQPWLYTGLFYRAGNAFSGTGAKS